MKYSVKILQGGFTMRELIAAMVLVAIMAPTMGLLVQILETGGRGLFIPEICLCGISIKDKHPVNPFLSNI